MKIKVLLAGCSMFLAVSLQAQEGYSNFSRQTTRLQALVKNHSTLASLTSLTKTAGGKDIWVVTIGAGKIETKPAIAVIGGIEGNNPLSTELAIGFAENLLQQSNKDSIEHLLQQTTFYIFPNINPDAMEQFFAPLRYERWGNAIATDDDRDGKLNEDPLDDLDKNGKITWLRVSSPIGKYKLHPDDDRVLIIADATKGDKGLYDMYSEGIDNDKDGEYNEDGEGGVNINKNFTFKHPSFTPGSGEFPVSEKETRALVDFLFDKAAIYAVISFGTNNNLSTPVAYNAAAATQRITAGWQETDVKVNGAVSELYNKVIGQKDAPKAAPGGGDFFSWAYFHYGRYSFSTPGWWVPKAKPDTTKNEKPFKVEDPSANYLRWAAQQGITNTFTPWKEITHPDFPGQKVEVGGIDPFVLYTPPYNLVADIVKKNSQFIIQLAALQPAIDIINVKTEKAGNGLTRITADVVNKGALPSHTKIGERSYWLKRVLVKANLSNTQSVLSGKKIQTLNTLDGYSSQQLSWLIKGSGKITLEAGSPTTGTKTITVAL